MTIKNGHLTKQLVLYPPAQSLVEHDLPMWVEEEEEKFYHSSPYPIFTLETIVGSKQVDEDDLIDNLLQNQPPTAMPIDELVE